MRKFNGLVVLAVWPLLAGTATQAAAVEAQAHYVITNGGVAYIDPVIGIMPVKAEQLRVGGPPPAPAPCVIEVYGVNFDFDKATLRPGEEPMLKQILALFSRAPGFIAEIGGHTDNVGTPEYNLKLSDARAASVKAWLQAHGVAPTRVASRGYGETRPLLPNTTDENRFKNRRVELRTASCR